MIDSCTSSGVDRKRAMYAPEMLRTMRFLLSRISASSSAGMMASRTDTTASSSVYSSPSHERRRVFGQEGEIEEVRLVHVDEQVAPPHRIWFLSLLWEALLHLALKEAGLPLFFDETSNVRKVQGRKAALHFAQENGMTV